MRIAILLTIILLALTVCAAALPTARTDEKPTPTQHPTPRCLCGHITPPPTPRWALPTPAPTK